ncbi:hypothetical protein [Pseudonocardia sp.]|uniref:hypothetical protein n=1 Tax=Pseudonocardia sp. TaxID=60912 RepID=UPI00261D34A4|nr:hypothetical protein [Pseudonocardia sp.]
MDPHHGHLRHEELLAAAAEHRLARTCRRPRAPLLVRLYVRLWWASRPRVGTWPRMLLDT